MFATWVHRACARQVPGTGIRPAAVFGLGFVRSNLLWSGSPGPSYCRRRAHTGRPRPCLLNETDSFKDRRLPQCWQATPLAKPIARPGMLRARLTLAECAFTLGCAPKRSCWFRPTADDLLRPFAVRRTRIGAKLPRSWASPVSRSFHKHHRKKPSSRLVSCSAVKARAATLARSGRTAQNATRSRSIVNIV